MFQQLDKDAKIEHLLHEKTTNIFGETTDDSFAFEVEAEREYVVRLKTQREKVPVAHPDRGALLEVRRTAEGAEEQRLPDKGERQYSFI